MNSGVGALIPARLCACDQLTGGAAARRLKNRFAERLFRGRFALNEPVQWFGESWAPQGQAPLRAGLRPLDPPKNHDLGAVG